MAFREVQWRALYGLGQLAEIQGDRQSAQRYYEGALAIIESARAALGSESLRRGFLTDKIEVYEAGLRVLRPDADAAADPSYMAKAFEYAERSKARAMLDLLGEAAAQIEQGIAPDLQLRRQQLRRELVRPQTGSPDLAATGALAERRAAVERELEAVDLRILESNPYYALIQEAKIPAWSDLPRWVLDSETALVMFFTGRQSIFVWVITVDAARSARIPNPSWVEERVRTYLQQLNSPASTAYAALSAELYDTLLKTSLEGLASTITRLIIVPDGFLYTLPFETLQARRPSDARRHFLVERFEISYTPSVSVLSVLRQIARRPDRPEKALFGMSVIESEPAGWSEGGEGRENGGRSDLAGLDPLRHADEELLRIQ